MRLRSSPLGADFPRERFLRLPIRVVLEALEFIDNEERRQHNLQSSTTAKLCMQVISIAFGFSGAKGSPPKIDFKDFLPFPDWEPLGEERGPGPSPETRAALTRLLREHKIPLAIYTQLISTESDSLS